MNSTSVAPALITATLLAGASTLLERTMDTVGGVLVLALETRKRGAVRGRASSSFRG
jgi:hypothetical protein